jgi:hypothetical protein
MSVFGHDLMGLLLQVVGGRALGETIHSTLLQKTEHHVIQIIKWITFCR